MMILLDLLDAANPATIQMQSLLVLVTALLATPANTRVFESLDGLLTVASLVKSRATPQELKKKTMEFFYFYLMPESTDQEEDGTTKTMEEKQRLLEKYLEKYLPNLDVSEMVQDLRETTPYAIAA